MCMSSGIISLRHRSGGSARVVQLLGRRIVARRESLFTYAGVPEENDYKTFEEILREATEQC